MDIFNFTYAYNVQNLKDVVNSQSEVCFGAILLFFVVVLYMYNIVKCLAVRKYMSMCVKKINNLGSDQVLHKPTCTVTEDGLEA